MTKDEVLKLAVEAGAYSPDNPDDYAFSVEELYRFADLVVAAERAKVYAAQEDPCPGCRKGGVCRTPKCGRLKLPADHPFRFERPEQEPVLASDTSEKRVDEMTKQRHEPEPVIDKSAAVRIATSLGWTPQRTWVGLTGFEQKELMAMSARDAVFATEAKLRSKNT